MGGAPGLPAQRKLKSATTAPCIMQSLDGFPDERIVDRGRIAVHKVVASGPHLPEMCRDPPMAEGRQVGSSVVPNSKGYRRPIRLPMEA